MCYRVSDSFIFSCKLYHKTTWFETGYFKANICIIFKLQIISQNYVVWNIWNITVKIFGFIVANYITKLRGLKLKAGKFKNDSGESCKLYHKTTWFETCHLWLILIAFQSVANYITKLRGLKRTITARARTARACCKLYHKTTRFETGACPRSLLDWIALVANYITKLRGLK